MTPSGSSDWRNDIEDGRVSYAFGGLRLRPSEYSIERLDAPDMPPIDLGEKQLGILLVLIRNPKRLVTKRTLFDEVWGKDQAVEDGALSAQIKLLRDALGDDAGTPRYIETVPRRGFRFLIDVTDEWVDAESDARTQTASDPSSFVPSENRGDRWIVDLSGEWHAIWETTAHDERNVNHEALAFSQVRANLKIVNPTASPDNPDGGYSWEARLTIHDNRHLVGAYWSTDSSVNARGTLYLVLNRTGRFITGVWAGCNIDSDLACGRVAMARTQESASAEFHRFTSGRHAAWGSPLFYQAQEERKSQ
jgi:DNA-binding winged helix-turn-helix (wHTH) protein